MANFGDQPLNTWLWPKLLPTQLRDDSPTLLVGIGTLLNERLPRQPHKIIFSAGAGYGHAQPDERWHVYCVRGPASAQRLGLAPEKAITDGAVLVRTLGLASPPKTYRVAYMPHWRSDYHGRWGKICSEAGVHFVDPTGRVENIIDSIQRSELILSEALHGAIVADALRVPWVPVKAYRHILDFKWQDWCASVGLRYHPVQLPAVYQESSVAEKVGRLWSGRLMAWLENFIVRPSQALAAPAYRLSRQRAAEALHRLASQAEPILSQDLTVERVTNRLLEQLEQLQRDSAAGRLFFDRQPS